MEQRRSLSRRGRISPLAPLKMPYSSRCFEVIKFVARERGIIKYLFVAALMALLTAPPPRTGRITSMRPSMPRRPNRHLTIAPGCHG